MNIIRQLSIDSKKRLSMGNGLYFLAGFSDDDAGPQHDVLGGMDTLFYEIDEQVHRVSAHFKCRL